MIKNQNAYVIVVIIVLAALAGGIYWSMQNNGSSGWNFYSNIQQNDNGTSGGSSSYMNALKLYANRRIQFDNGCLLVPNTVTYKVGTTIMLDNRSSKRTTISLDNVGYTINAYDYAIVTLYTNAPLPHTISVDCGKGQNNGSILLQK